MNVVFNLNKKRKRDIFYYVTYGNVKLIIMFVLIKFVKNSAKNVLFDFQSTETITTNNVVFIDNNMFSNMMNKLETTLSIYHTL